MGSGGRAPGRSRRGGGADAPLGDAARPAGRERGGGGAERDGRVGDGGRGSGSHGLGLERRPAAGLEHIAGGAACLRPRSRPVRSAAVHAAMRTRPRRPVEASGNSGQKPRDSGGARASRAWSPRRRLRLPLARMTWPARARSAGQGRPWPAPAGGAPLTRASALAASWAREAEGQNRASPPTSRGSSPPRTARAGTPSSTGPPPTWRASTSMHRGMAFSRWRSGQGGRGARCGSGATLVEGSRAPTSRARSPKVGCAQPCTPVALRAR